MTLYLFKHSNYYNRILKRYDDINDYIENSIQLGVYQNINFKPYDGVQTFQILNHQGETPDYIICVDDSLAIDSRWYVVEDERLLNGQYRYTLLRDVISDYYNDILRAPCFVEKALLPVDSQLIHNKEDMSFNQIKTTECLLKDDIESRWIVGYVDNRGVVDGTDPTNVSGNFIEGNVDYADAQTIDDSLFNILASGNTYYLNDKNFVPILEFGNENYFLPGGSWAYTWIRSNVNIAIRYNSYATPESETKYNNVKTSISIGYRPDFISCTFTGKAPKEDQRPINAIKSLSDDKNSTLVGYISNAVSQMGINILSEANYNNILELINTGAKIKRGTSVYQVELSVDKINDNPYAAEGGSYYEFKNNLTVAKNIINIFNEAMRDSGANMVMTDDDSVNLEITNNTIYGNSEFPDVQPMNVHLSKNTRMLQFRLKEIGGYKYRFNLSGSTGRVRNDSGLYDMFAIPYDPIYYEVRRNQTSSIIDTGKTTTDLSLKTAYNIAHKLQNALYDIQILPYCPCPEYFTNKALIFRDVNKLGNGYYDTVRIQNGTEPNDNEDRIVGLILWCNSSKRHFTIRASRNDVPINIVNPYTKALTKKVDSLTKTCRLCSPGYTSIFEINVAMNDGIDQFVIDILYQPINPFIRIAPKFKSLYGIYTQYDSKGLILKGDYSLPTIINSWEQYQINNKNYNEIYDREIQSLQLSQNIERKQQMWQIATGTISGTTSGAVTGAMASGGHPIGAIAGGVAGGGASLIGGIADLQYADILRGEALDYKKDMFGYSLANIQALPQALTKSSPLSNNNPIWPIFEIYEASQTEKSALIEKIKYNGMSVGVIGTLDDYIDNIEFYRSDGFDKMYFKGTLIKLDSIYADSHIVNAISNELNRGIYL